MTLEEIQNLAIEVLSFLEQRVSNDTSQRDVLAIFGKATVAFLHTTHDPMAEGKALCETMMIALENEMKDKGDEN